MPPEPVPLAFQQLFAEMDELQLQVRTLGADWDALIQTAARFPEPMAEIWRVVYDYLVTTDRPREGSIENAICAEYILRVKTRRPFEPPATPNPPATSMQHKFIPEASGVDLCQVCKGRSASGYHMPPHGFTPSQHRFVASAIADQCEACGRGPNSAIHRPGAPR